MRDSAQIYKEMICHQIPSWKTSWDCSPPYFVHHHRGKFHELGIDHHRLLQPLSNVFFMFLYMTVMETVAILRVNHRVLTEVVSFCLSLHSL